MRIFTKMTMQTKKRIMVTGGAGFIGSHLIERLLKDDLGPVTVLDNLHRGLTPKAGIEPPARFVDESVAKAGPWAWRLRR